MSRIIQPVVSPRGRVIVLTGATLWLVAAMILSAAPDPAAAAPRGAGNVATVGGIDVIEQIGGTEELLFWPRAVATRGQIFVADRGSRRVLRLNENLDAVLVIGREGAGPGEFHHPYDVAVDSQGNIFVVDVGLRRLSKFGPDGVFIKSVAAPNVATLLIDSQDRLIVYPAPGEALMRRYSNDLEPGEDLLRERDAQMHQTSRGILMAMDSRDRLFVLDQTDLSVTVYDRSMQPILEWSAADAPELRASMAASRASAEANNPGQRVTIPGYQAMALAPGSDHLALSYLVRRPGAESFARIAWYTVDGHLLATEDRPGNVYASALLGDGRVIEGTEEALLVTHRDPQTRGVVRGN